MEEEIRRVGNIYIYIPVAFSFRILFRSGKSLILARGSKYRKVDIIVVRVLFGKIDLFGIFEIYTGKADMWNLI